jgi:uncharacterized cupredoxin-like copper-binding protein
MAKRLAMFVLAVVGLTAATDCSGGETEATAPADAQRLTVSFGDSLQFDPPTLTVQAGKPVLLTVQHLGTTDHDFSIRDMPVKDVTNKVEGGHGHGGAGMVVGHPKAKDEVTVRFTPTTAGTYEFFCSVTGHRELGMVGALTVT